MFEIFLIICYFFLLNKNKNCNKLLLFEIYIKMNSFKNSKISAATSITMVMQKVVH